MRPTILVGPASMRSATVLNISREILLRIEQADYEWHSGTAFETSESQPFIWSQLEVSNLEKASRYSRKDPIVLSTCHRWRGRKPGNFLFLVGKLMIFPKSLMFSIFLALRPRSDWGSLSALKRAFRCLFSHLPHQHTISLCLQTR